MFATFRRSLSRVLAMVAIACAAAIAAGTAHATTTSRLVDFDDVSTLGSGSFEFRSGTLSWWWDSEISAHLKGEIKLDDANGSCARMRMEYFNDSVSITTKYGGTVCAPDGKSHSYTVDINPYGDPNIDLVKVSLQKETASGWSIVESAYFKPTLDTTKVRLTADGVDFGDDYWGVSSPIGSGTLEWGQGEGMNLTPHLRGYIWLNNVAGLCARVDLTYFTLSGAVLAEKHGGSVCAPDNSRYTASVDLAPYTSDQISSVAVNLQTQGSDGSWNGIWYYGYEEFI